MNVTVTQTTDVKQIRVVMDMGEISHHLTGEYIEGSGEIPIYILNQVIDLPETNIAYIGYYNDIAVLWDKDHKNLGDTQLSQVKEKTRRSDGESPRDLKRTTGTFPALKIA